ncbi:MAG: hypothetical protein WBV69_23405, partial [Candidatus Sulfotelmatobacter sp.]
MRIAVLAALALGTASCHTAQKPVAAVPPGNPPSLSATEPIPTPPEARPAPPTDIQQTVQTAQSKLEPAALPPSADEIGDLLARVENEYQAGLANYQAGRRDVAKMNFDNAFNFLLESKLDIRSDDRLEKEFDHIVDGVNHLDLGDSFSDSEAQKSEPAPIDETNGITPSADPNVKAKAQADIKSTHSDLPLMMTDQVAGYISYFSNRGRGSFERAFARSGR